MKKPKKAKKKNPQDATLRNIRALKKRVSELENLANMLLDEKRYYARIVNGVRQLLNPDDKL